MNFRINRPGFFLLIPLLATSLCLAYQNGRLIQAQEQADRLIGAEDPAQLQVAEGNHHLLGFLFPQEPFDTEEIVEKLPGRKALAEARLKLAEQQIDQLNDRYLAPPRPDQPPIMDSLIEDYLLWAGRRLDAKLDLNEQQEARIALLAEEIAVLRHLENMIRQLGVRPRSAFSGKSLADLEFSRLQQETRLSKLLEAKQAN